MHVGRAECSQGIAAECHGGPSCDTEIVQRLPVEDLTC